MGRYQNVKGFFSVYYVNDNKLLLQRQTSVFLSTNRTALVNYKAKTTHTVWKYAGEQQLLVIIFSLSFQHLSFNLLSNG